jgi:hypothetical protein
VIRVIEPIWILDNGCEVCDVCFATKKTHEKEKQECLENLSRIEKEEFYYKKRLQELDQKLQFTPEQIKTGIERKIWRQNGNCDD